MSGVAPWRLTPRISNDNRRLDQRQDESPAFFFWQDMFHHSARMAVHAAFAGVTSRQANHAVTTPADDQFA
jgi:hypothetical protein